MLEEIKEEKAQSGRRCKFLTTDEVSEMLQISKITLRAWTSQRKIPHFKVGRSVRFNLEKLQAWLNEREINTRG